MAYTPTNSAVWFELPVADLDRAIEFYSAATGATITKEQMGPDVTAMFKPADPETGVAGHLYKGKPSGDGTGPTVHLAAEGTVEQMMERVWAAGGAVVSPAIEIPPGRFFYATDPDGNSIGLFELA